VRIARELVATIRQLNRAIAEVDEELAQRTADLAPALLEGSFGKAELSSQTTNLTLSRRESSRCAASIGVSSGSRPPPGIAQCTPTSSLSYLKRNIAPDGSMTATLTACLGCRMTASPWGPPAPEQ
jgi:hypothetical protein